MNLNNLVPHVGQQRQRQVAVGNGALVLALLLGALHIDVNPLVVERGVGKEVDSVLVYLQPLGGTKFLAQVGSKFIVAVDD